MAFTSEWQSSAPCCTTHMHYGEMHGHAQDMRYCAAEMQLGGLCPSEKIRPFCPIALLAISLPSRSINTSDNCFVLCGADSPKDRDNGMLCYSMATYC